jgi:DNA-binding protein H-NS
MKDLQTRKSVKGASKAGRPAKVKLAKAPKAARKTGQPVAAKFRGPNGETWSGRGLTPKWLASLVAQGHSKESFAVASPAAE